jgi:hypothetical protein
LRAISIAVCVAGLLGAELLTKIMRVRLIARGRDGSRHMFKIGLFFGSFFGNTEQAAVAIKHQLAHIAQVIVVVCDIAQAAAQLVDELALVPHLATRAHIDFEARAAQTPPHTLNDE